MFRKILGLDLGTNSIGWALIEQDDERKNRKYPGSRKSYSSYESGYI